MIYSVLKRKDLLFPLLLMGLNLLVKGLFITSNSIAGDEPFSIYHAQMDVSSIIEQLAGGNNPPLYEIILHFWTELFGISALSVRLPSLIFSTLTVLFIYKLGNAFFSRRVAVTTALLFILSNYHVLFAHEARAYALLGLLSVVSMYYYLKIVVHENFRYTFIVSFVVAGVALIYTHYFGLFVLWVQFIMLLFYKDLLFRHRRHFLAMGLAIFLSYIPNVKVFVVRFLDSSINGTWIAPVVNLGNLHDMFYLFANSNTTGYLIVISLFWGVAGVFLYRMKIHKAIKVVMLLIIVPLFYLTSVSVFVSMPFIWRLTSQRAYVVLFLLLLSLLVVYVLFGRHNKRLSSQLRIVLGWFWLPFLFMFLLSLEFMPFNVPVFYDRYLMFLSIAFCFQVAILANELFRWRILNYVLSAAIITTWAVTVKPDLSNKRDVQETVELVAALNTDKTVVYFCPSWFDMNFTYYYNIDCFKNYNTEHIKQNMQRCMAKDDIYPINNKQAIDTSKLHQFDKVIFLDAGADFSFPDNGILNKINQHATLENKYEFYEIFKVYAFRIE